MKNRLFMLFGKKLICFIFLLILLSNVSSVGVYAQHKSYVVGDMENIIDDIVDWKMTQTSSASVQELISKGLSPYAGTSPTEWYIVALRQYKNSYDYTAYVNALNQYTKGTMSSKETDLQRIAIAFAAVGGNSEFIQSTIDGSTGKLGIMSYVYELILLDSGAYSSTVVDRNLIINKILSLGLSDGGWALTGSVSDIDVTAMAVQALAPYVEFSDVKSAVEKALVLLSNRQLENGDFASWGTRCCESTAQVITALSTLNIDCQTDSRFIKNGNSLVDGLMLYKLPDGSFSHTIGGNSNNTSSVQAIYSLVSAWRQLKKLGALYQFTSEKIAREQNVSSNSNAVASLNKTSSAAGGSVESSATTGTADTSPDLGEATSSTDFAEQTTSSVPDTSAETSAALENTQNEHNAVSYRVWACVLICLLALCVVAVLMKRKKNNKQNVVLVLALTVAALLAVIFINFQSADDYYLVHIDDIKPDSKTVFISIRCDSITDKPREDFLPSDGCILEKTEYVLREGDTAFDVLVRATKHNKIQMEFAGSASNAFGTAYIKGIQNLYEYDFGETSGWMYKVNDVFMDVGCSNYVMSDGDYLEWVYTCELGKDVGDG